MKEKLLLGPIGKKYGRQKLNSYKLELSLWEEAEERAKKDVFSFFQEDFQLCRNVAKIQI